MHPLRETVHPARNHISIVTCKCTTSEPRNVRLLVQPVAKPFTTAHLTTLIFPPLINNPPLQLENAPPRKHQMLRPRKDLRGRTKQARVPLQNQPPWQVLKPTVKTRTNTPEIAASLLRRSHRHFQALSTWTNTKTISHISKISPGTPNSSAVLVAVNTGRNRPD